jgi:hypothetical protein
MELFFAFDLKNIHEKMIWGSENHIGLHLHSWTLSFLPVSCSWDSPTFLICNSKKFCQGKSIAFYFIYPLPEHLADCWENVSRSEKGSSLLLDLGEVSTCWGFPWFGLATLHLQVHRTTWSPSFISYMLLPAVFPTLSLHGYHARSPPRHHPRTCWMQFWHLVMHWVHSLSG